MARVSGKNRLKVGDVNSVDFALVLRVLTGSMPTSLSISYLSPTAWLSLPPHTLLPQSG